MFYAHFVLAKKGPLARIWLAAHWDKKLTKAHVFETNIEKSVDGILQPKVKMALRTSGHLLLGVVRIYSRKAKYLLADCNEAFVKIKMAFRPGMVDLPEDIREAAVSAITFPEVFHDFDTPMPELNDVDIQAQFTLNQSRAEEITMREDYGNISLVTGDDGFGDMGFEEPPELMRATSAIDQNMDQTNLIFGDNIDKERDANSSKEQNSRLSANRANASALDLEAPIRDDGFGGNLGQDMIAGGLFEGGLFDDAPIEEAPPLDSGQPDKDEKIPDDSDDDGGDLDRFGGPPSVGPPSSDGGSPCPSPMPESRPEGLVDDPQANNEPAAEPQEAAEEVQDQTTLLHNDEESFALAPVDSTVIKSGWPRTKRKRKLIVDEVKNISGEEMKAQLSDTTDIVTTLDLAPPSKRLMHWKETGGVEKLFALPGRSINAMTLGKMYVRNLTSEHALNEDFGMAGDKEIENLRLEQVRDEEVEPLAPRPRGRPPKRKHPEPDFHYEEEKPPTKSKEESFNELLASQKDAEQPALALEPEDQMNDTPAPEPLMSPPADAAADEPDLPMETQPTPVENEEAAPIPPEVPKEQEQEQEDIPQADTADTADSDAHLHDILSSPMAQESHPMEDDLEPPQGAPEVHDEEPPPPAALEPFSPQSGPKSVHSEHAHSPSRAEDGDEYVSSVRAEDDGDYEEQAEDETYEQFEERVVNKRAGLMFHNIKRRLRHSSINFKEFTLHQNRKMVAQRFYTMLVLKKLQAVELSQEGAYSEVVITRGHLFEKATI